MSYHYEDSTGHSFQILRDIACYRRIQQDFASIIFLLLKNNIDYILKLHLTI